MKAKECPQIQRKVHGEAGFNSRVINNSFFADSDFDDDFAASVTALLATQSVDHYTKDQQFKHINPNIRRMFQIGYLLMDRVRKAERELQEKSGEDIAFRFDESAISTAGHARYNDDEVRAFRSAVMEMGEGRTD